MQVTQMVEPSQHPPQIIDQSDHKAKLQKDKKQSESSNSQIANRIGTTPSYSRQYRSKLYQSKSTNNSLKLFGNHSFQNNYRYLDSPPSLQLPTEEMTLSSKMEMFYNRSEENFSSGIDVAENEEYDLSEKEIPLDIKSALEKDIHEGNSKHSNGGLGSNPPSKSSRENFSSSHSLPKKTNGEMSPKEQLERKKVMELTSLPPSLSSSSFSSSSYNINLEEQVVTLDNKMANPNSKNVIEANAEVEDISLVSPFEIFDEVLESSEEDLFLNKSHESESEEYHPSFFSYSSSSNSLTHENVPENLQEEIDHRIEDAVKNGHLNMANMGLPFFPCAVLSTDLSMITVSIS